MTRQSQRVLHFLADLADSSGPRKVYRIDTDNFRWMPLSYTKLFRGESGRRGKPGPMQDGFTYDAVTQRILMTARLHDEEGMLRVGWMWVAGRHPELGKVFCPLASMPVQLPPLYGVANRLNRTLRAGYKFADVIPASELEVTELVEDPAVRDRLSAIPHGDSMFAVMASSFVNPMTRRNAPGPRQQAADLKKWSVEAAAAAGLDATTLVGAEHDPDRFMAEAGLSIVLGVGLYVAEPEREAPRITTAATLRAWADLDVRGTAFDFLYADGEPHDPDAGLSDSVSPAVPSSLLLNPAQARVVATSGHKRLTVVSGPPGTGKSQTVVAAALDHVREGRSVLVAAPTDAAVSALVALLEAAPGPDPIVFGASIRRLDVANRLGEGGGPWFDDSAVEKTQLRFDEAIREHQRSRGRSLGCSQPKNRLASSFQGCQRDVIYISLAIDDDSPQGSRSFLSEATLFNVMVTRAKERVHVVSSATTPSSGLLNGLPASRRPAAWRTFDFGRCVPVAGVGALGARPGWTARGVGLPEWPPRG